MRRSARSLPRTVPVARTQIAHLVLLAQIIQQCPAAAVEQRLLVIAQAMQKIQNGVTLRWMLRPALIVTGGNKNAIANRALQDATVECAAVNPALCGCRACDQPKGS